MPGVAQAPFALHYALSHQLLLGSARARQGAQEPHRASCCVPTTAKCLWPGISRVMIGCCHHTGQCRLPGRVPPSPEPQLRTLESKEPGPHLQKRFLSLVLDTADSVNFGMSRKAQSLGKAPKCSSPMSQPHRGSSRGLARAAGQSQHSFGC